MEVPHSLPLLRHQFLQKATNYSIYLFFFSLGLIFNSCSSARSDDFVLLQTSSPYDFHTIEEYEGTLYASGGDIWNKSNLVTSIDGSQWKTDSLTNKSIFDLYTYDQTLYGVGNDGYIFSGDPDLKLTRTKFWGLLRAFTSSNKGFIAAGGKDFNKGWLYKVNSNLLIDTAFYFKNEILDVSCSSNGMCIACGYGLILTSNDAGNSWLRSPEIGDYYNSIGLNQKEEFFIVGYNGTIIRSKDKGESWTKLKNGHSPLANNKPFRTIKFKGEVGIITGDNGLIWISHNSGMVWEDISINTDMDIFDFTFFQSSIICVSEAGQLFNVKI